MMTTTYTVNQVDHSNPTNEGSMDNPFGRDRVVTSTPVAITTGVSQGSGKSYLK